MYIPSMPKPSGFQSFRQSQTAPSGSGGTLGSVMSQAKKLKALNKWKFQTGTDDELALVSCPGCGEESCHYIGGGPKDIECLNRACEFFKLPPNAKVQDDDEDTKEIDLDFGIDWGIGNP